MHTIDKIDFIYIEITPAMKAKAMEMSKARRQNWETSKHISENDDYYGALGELAIRRLLYEKNRAYTFSDARGETDNGIDLTINAGTVNVKASNISPEIYYRMIAKSDVNDTADYFIQCFLQDDECIFAGMERRDNLIQEENLGELKSEKYDTKFMAYMKQIQYLSIKPAFLLDEPYTISNIGNLNATDS